MFLFTAAAEVTEEATEEKDVADKSQEEAPTEVETGAEEKDCPEKSEEEAPAEVETGASDQAPPPHEVDKSDQPGMYSYNVHFMIY